MNSKQEVAVLIGEMMLEASLGFHYAYADKQRRWALHIRRGRKQYYLAHHLWLAPVQQEEVHRIQQEVLRQVAGA